MSFFFASYIQVQGRLWFHWFVLSFIRIMGSTELESFVLLASDVWEIWFWSQWDLLDRQTYSLATGAWPMWGLPQWCKSPVLPPAPRAPFSSVAANSTNWKGNANVFQRRWCLAYSTFFLSKTNYFKFHWKWVNVYGKHDSSVAGDAVPLRWFNRALFETVTASTKDLHCTGAHWQRTFL